MSKVVFVAAVLMLGACGPKAEEAPPPPAAMDQAAPATDSTARDTTAMPTDSMARDTTRM